MRKLVSVIGLMGLAACGGGDSAHKLDTSNTKSEYEIVRASNREVTGITQSVDNQADTVAYVYDRLGLDMPSTGNGTTSTANQHIGHSTTQSDRDKVNIMGNLYAGVVEKFKVLTQFEGQGIPDGLTDAQMVESYKIAGGGNTYDETTQLSDQDKENICAFVQANYQNVLNKYFKYDTNTGDWVWQPISQNLADIHLKNTENTQVTFTLNNKGKIIDINRITRDGNATSYERIDKNIFKYKTDDGINRATLAMFGAKNNLQYADFGSLTVERAVQDDNGATTYTPVSKDYIAGGYNLKQVEVANMSGEYNFSGQAVGTVQNQNGDSIVLDSSATLNFNNGTETLGMNFSENNWYDVEIVRDHSQDTFSSTISFDGTDVKDGFAISENGTHSTDIKYYGDFNTPSEFSGTACYQDDNIKMDAAFGGVKQ